MDFATLTDPGTLVQKIEEAAVGINPATRELVDALTADVTNAQNLDQWSEIDLAGTLARPENFAAAGPVAAARPWLLSAGWERIAEAVLSCLVFVPLLITWTGLFEASNAYAQLSRTDKTQATRPFLQLWESGFDGRLSHWFRFGDVALAAVVFISTLLALALVHSASRYKAQKAEEEVQAREERSSAALALVLSRTQLYLARFRLTSPARFTASLTDAADALRELILDARQAQDSVTAVLSEAQRISKSLDNAADKMNSATDVIDKASTRVQQVLQEGTDSLTELQRTGAASLKQVLDEGLEALQQGQRATLDAVELVRRSGTEAVDAARRAAEAAVSAAARAAEDASVRNEAALRGIEDRFERGSGQIESALHGLALVQQQLSDRSAALAEAVGRIVESLKDTSSQTAQSAQLVLQQANVAIDELRNSVEGWDEAAAHWVGAAQAVELRMGGLTGEPGTDRHTARGARTSAGWNGHVASAGANGQASPSPGVATGIAHAAGTEGAAGRDGGDVWRSGEDTW